MTPAAVQPAANFLRARIARTLGHQQLAGAGGGGHPGGGVDGRAEPGRAASHGGARVQAQAPDERRVVGETLLAPRVLVAALLHGWSGDEQVVQAIAAAPARPAPADLAALVAVQAAKSVAKAERPQPADEQQFGGVPALS